MPRKKKTGCPVCYQGSGEYFAIVFEPGNPMLVLKEVECPIDGKRKAPKPAPAERVHPVLFAGEPT